MKKTLPQLLAALALIAVLGGCQPVRYYQNRAVERARKFLLENARELTPQQAYFVKFNDPVLLSAPIIGSTDYEKEPEKLNLEQQQICVTWRIPGVNKDYMVYGTSKGTMEFWYPIRLIRKSTAPRPKQAYDSAIAACRTYAINALWERLTPAELNLVRFHFPTLMVTNFELNWNPTGLLTGEEVKKLRAAAAGKTQFSLVWKTSDREWVVFTGIAAASLAGWKVDFAGTNTPDEVNKHTKKVIRTPEDGDTPFDCAADVNAMKTGGTTSREK